MKSVLRCMVVMTVALLVMGQSFAPFYEAHLSRVQCLLSHRHHVDWMLAGTDDDADDGRDDAPNQHHRLCCHLKTHILVATAHGWSISEMRLPTGTVRRHSTDNNAAILLQVLVPPG